MKKILMRAVISPFDEASAYDILTKNRIGSNMGNMIFPYSVMRNLMTEDMVIDTTVTNKTFTEKEIDYINSEYECLVMPFANAFRANYVGELQNLTKLIKKLKIPFVVVGIGCSHSLKQDLNSELPYDDAAREFIKAVLNKSATIGLRGESTAEYLKHLGFKEETEYRVIGCPSMYLWGPYLPDIEKKELRPDSPVSVNWKINIPVEVHNYMKRSLAELTNYQYVPQILDEMMMMYYGTPLPGKKKYPRIPEGYPSMSNHPFYTEGKAKAFVNVPSWMEYLRTKDLSFGTRIHGNIVPLLAGIPSYIVAPDHRVTELARYHDIPHTMYTDLKEDDTIFTLYEKADYAPMLKNHRERYERYSAFLKENGLTPVLDQVGKMEKTIFDEQVEQVNRQNQQVLEPFFSATVEEQARRLEEIEGYYVRRYNELKKKYDQVEQVDKTISTYADKFKRSLKKIWK